MGLPCVCVCSINEPPSLVWQGFMDGVCIFGIKGRSICASYSRSKWVAIIFSYCRPWLLFPTFLNPPVFTCCFSVLLICSPYTSWAGLFSLISSIFCNLICHICCIIGFSFFFICLHCGVYSWPFFSHSLPKYKYTDMMIGWINRRTENGTQHYHNKGIE